MYLSGVLAYLEDKYGQRPWNIAGSSYDDFDDYISNSNINSFKKTNVSKNLLNALVAIRNAVIHNGGDPSKNRVANSYDIVFAENIPNLSFNGTIV